MENSLIYIIRGAPAPIDESIIVALADYLEARAQSPESANSNNVRRAIQAAELIMEPLPEYDISDFNSIELTEAFDLLEEGDATLWSQLLHALDDRHSPHWRRLKQLSPFRDAYLMFLDVTGDSATQRAELDDDLAEELLKRADAHTFPGNCYTVVVPAELLDQLRFVSAIDDLPATA